MEESVAKICKKIEETRSRKKKGTRILVAIAGIPGSGKSTLAKVVQKRFPKEAIVVPMDGFHYYKKELEKFPDPKKAFDRRGAAFTFNSMKHGIGDPIEKDIKILKSHKIVIVEGLYLLSKYKTWGEMFALYDLRIFISLDVSLAMRRTLERHLRAWDITREKAQERIDGNDQPNALDVIRGAEGNWDVCVDSKDDPEFVEKGESSSGE